MVHFPQSIRPTLAENRILRRTILGESLDASGVAAFVFDARLIFVGINCMSGLIKIFGADMERLVNVAEIMREQDYRDGLGDFARIIGIDQIEFFFW